MWVPRVLRPARRIARSSPSTAGSWCCAGWIRKSRAGTAPESTCAAARAPEDRFRSGWRIFLKKVGITSQREIEKAVREAAARGALKPNQKLPATMRLHVGGIELLLQIDGEIDLD